MKTNNGKIIRYPNVNNADVQSIFHIYQLADGKLLLSGGGVLFELDSQIGKYNTYSGKYIIYTAELIDLYKKLTKDSLEIVSINKVKNNQDISKEFELRKTD